MTGFISRARMIAKIAVDAVGEGDPYNISD